MQSSQAQKTVPKAEAISITVWVKNPNSPGIVVDIEPITLAPRPAKHNQQKMLLDATNKAMLNTVLEGPSVVKLLNVWPDSTISYIAIPGASLSIHLDGLREETGNHFDVGPGETEFYNDILETSRQSLKNIPQQDPQLYLTTWSKELDEVQEKVKATASLGISSLYTKWISQSVESLFQSELCHQLVTYVTMTHKWPVNLKDYAGKMPSFTEAQFNQPALFTRETDKQLAESYYLFHSLNEFNSKNLPPPGPETIYRAAIVHANRIKAESSRTLMLRYLCSTAIAHTTDTSFLKWMNTAVTFGKETQYLKNMIAGKQNLLLKIGKGKLAPPFEASDISGEPFSFGNFKGKYLFIDIWATWCVPCRKEIPYLEQLKQKYTGQPIEFISVSTDKNPGAWKRYMESADTSGQFHSLPGKPSSVSDVYDADLIPTFILIDPQGRIVNPRCFRPSDPELTFLLDQLLPTIISPTQ